MNKFLTTIGLLLVIFGIFVMIFDEVYFLENLPTWSRIVIGILIIDVGGLIIPKLRSTFKISDKFANFFIILWAVVIVTIYIMYGV